MEQIIKADTVEKQIRDDIEKKYNVRTYRADEIKQLEDKYDSDSKKPRAYSDAFISYFFEEKAKSAVAFYKNDEAGEEAESLVLSNYSTAVRRTPPWKETNRLACMADVYRCDVGMMELMLQGGKSDKRDSVIKAALEYQYNMKRPFVLMNKKSCGGDTEFFAGYGFSHICDDTEFILNKDIITEDMLRAASRGETVTLNPSTITLSAVDSQNSLTAAHFMNACLCRKYGFFVIRTANYVERMKKEVKSLGGDLYQIRENDVIVGFFGTYVKTDDGGEAADMGNKDRNNSDNNLDRNNSDNNNSAKKQTICIGEAIFHNEHEMERYIQKIVNKKPSIMARIVNLQEMLRYITSDGRVTIAVRVIDDIIEKNNGLFIWYLDESGSCMERISGSDESNNTMKPELTVTIGELTAFFFEYMKLKPNIKFDSIYLIGPAWIKEN